MTHLQLNSLDQRNFDWWLSTTYIKVPSHSALKPIKICNLEMSHCLPQILRINVLAFWGTHIIRHFFPFLSTMQLPIQTPSCWFRLLCITKSTGSWVFFIFCHLNNDHPHYSYPIKLWCQNDICEILYYNFLYVDVSFQNMYCIHMQYV